MKILSDQFVIDYTILETPNSSFTSFQSSTVSTWQPSTSAGSSYWTNQMTNSTNASPPATSGIQNISPTRSPGSPYATPSPSATYHPLTTPLNQTQTYQNVAPVTATSSEFQGNNSPHAYHPSAQPSPVVPVPQSHQLYYPTSLSPSHQIYGNVGFSNFSYAPGWSHSAPHADYGLFHQNTYHYQPTAEYISLINETG